MTPEPRPHTELEQLALIAADNSRICASETRRAVRWALERIAALEATLTAVRGVVRFAAEASKDYCDGSEHLDACLECAQLLPSLSDPFAVLASRDAEMRRKGAIEWTERCITGLEEFSDLTANRVLIAYLRGKLRDLKEGQEAC